MGFPGGVAYADRKIAMWMDIKSSVEPQFRAVNPDYQQRIIWELDIEGPEGIRGRLILYKLINNHNVKKKN